MSDIKTRKLKKDEYKIWDKLVESSPYGTIFHKSFWLNTCSELLNKTLKIYGCFEKDQLIAGCSLFVQNSIFSKTASSIVELMPYGGVVSAPSASTKTRKREQIYRHAINSLCDAFDNEYFDRIRIINSPDLIDVRPFIWNGWDSSVRYTYYFDLEGDIEKSCSKDARRQLKRAVDGGIKIKKLRNPTIFYDLFSMTFKRQNLNPPVTKEFFEKIITYINSENIGEMWIAETPSGEVTATKIILWDNKRAHLWAASSHPILRHTGSNVMLHYTIFQDLKNKGFKEINLMSANMLRLAKFATVFGPRLIPYYSVEKLSLKFKLLTSPYGILKDIVLVRSVKKESLN